MTKKIHQKKIRLPRKLKKAVAQCVGYYDGFYLVPPSYPGLPIRYKRRTKWIERAVDRYDPLAFDWADTRFPQIQNKRGKMIDECISHLYYRQDYKNVGPNSKRYMPHRKTSLKWHREHREIFVHAWAGVVYPKGAWVPKERPKDTYYRACSMKEDIPADEKFIVEHNVYSYEKLQHVRVEKFYITKEEFDDKEISARKLFLKYLSERPEKLIKVEEENAK